MTMSRAEIGEADEKDERKVSAARPNASILTVPAPIKRLFDQFPLVAYAPNPLPIRSSIAHERGSHALFIWSTTEDAAVGAASFNPGCLKWQAYLASRGIDFQAVASNNHASASDRLPFLIPPTNSPAPFKGNSPVSTTELSKWAVREDENSRSKDVDPQHDAYMSLIDNPIRRAWLYHMYLTPNFERFTVPCYIDSQSSSSFVRLLSTWDLRKAARQELLKQSSAIDESAVYLEADEAFKALDVFLAQKHRIHKSKQPSLLEASLFGYLFLLFSMAHDAWKDSRLADIVGKYPRLKSFTQTMNGSYFRNMQPPEMWVASRTDTKDIL